MPNCFYAVIMNRLRRKFLHLHSKKRRSELTDSPVPQQWLEDKNKVKASSCSFLVEYLGSIQVFESKGAQVCEEANRALRKSNKKPWKAILYVNGDSLRVADALSQHLISDQPVEKVSFCAPDRDHEKGFAYICRDTATRRWMCHSFIGINVSGERLSHAVGHAFSICLENKKKREQEALKLSCSTTSGDRGFFRTSSCRPQLPSVAQRLIDPQSAVVAKALPSVSSQGAPSTALATTGSRVNGSGGCSALPADAAAPSTGTVARPRPSSSVYEGQTPLRIFPKLQNASPFKRERLPSSPQRGLGLTNSRFQCILEEESSREDEEKQQLPPPPSFTAFSTALSATYQQQTGPAVGGNHQTGFLSRPAGGAALSPVPTQPSNTGPLTVVSSQITAAPGGQQYRAVHGFPHFAGGGPPAASLPLLTSLPSLLPSSVSTVGSSIATVNGHHPNSSWLSSGASNAVYAQSGMSTGNPPALPVASTGVSLCYMPPAPPLASVAARQPPVWSSALPTAAGANYSPSVSTSSSAWPSSVPLLLPPEPDRFSDPFDLGWLERATAVLNQSTCNRPSNPFADGLSSTTSAAQPVVPFLPPANGRPVCPASSPPGQPRPSA